MYCSFTSVGSTISSKSWVEPGPNWVVTEGDDYTIPSRGTTGPETNSLSFVFIP